MHGRFVYQTTSAGSAESNGSDGFAYRQRIENGFVAHFGDFEVRVDDYIVYVLNDEPQPANQIADVVTVLFASNVIEEPYNTIRVNDVAYGSGQLGVSFLQFGGEQFDDPKLDKLESLPQYDATVVLLGDSGLEQTADVFAEVGHLIQIQLVSGDIDLDMKVDGADFLRWQRVFQTDDVAADVDENGSVDYLDLSAWIQHFGGGANDNLTQKIPEPLAIELGFGPMVLAMLISRTVSGRARRTWPCESLR